MRLNTENAVSLDIETLGLREDISLCKWSRPKPSIIGIYSAAENEYNLFTPNNIDEVFALLDQASLIVGWNILSFDFIVLRQYRNVRRYYKKSFDIMHYLRRRTKLMLSLDNVSRATLGMGKKFGGKKALEEMSWAQQVEYNKTDTLLAWNLVMFGIVNSFLAFTDPKNFQRREVNVRWA